MSLSWPRMKQCLHFFRQFHCRKPAVLGPFFQGGEVRFSNTLNSYMKERCLYIAPILWSADMKLLILKYRLVHAGVAFTLEIFDKMNGAICFHIFIWSMQRRVFEDSPLGLWNLNLFSFMSVRSNRNQVRFANYLVLFPCCWFSKQPEGASVRA